MHRDEQAVDVEYRQRVQQHICRGKAPDLHQREAITGQVGMGQHDALGPAGGARGINNHVDIFGINACEALCHALWMGLQVPSALFDEFVVKDDIFMGKSPQAFGIPDDDFFKIQLRFHLKIFVDLFLVFHKEHGGLRVADDIGDLFRGIGGINPAGGAADAHGCQITNQPLRSIVAQNGDTGAGLKP